MGEGAGMNVWVGIGRATRDAETRFSQSGTCIASFAIAVDRDRKDAQGNKQTDFVNCVMFGKGAEALAQYITKGRLLAVNGSWNNRRYENREGQKVSVWEVNVNNVQFLDRGNDGGAHRSQQPSQPESRYAEDPFADDGTIDVDDGDLPF